MPSACHSHPIGKSGLGSRGFRRPGSVCVGAVRVGQAAVGTAGPPPGRPLPPLAWLLRAESGLEKEPSAPVVKDELGTRRELGVTEAQTSEGAGRAAGRALATSPGSSPLPAAPPASFLKRGPRTADQDIVRRTDGGASPSHPCLVSSSLRLALSPRPDFPPGSQSRSWRGEAQNWKKMKQLFFFIFSGLRYH